MHLQYVLKNSLKKYYSNFKVTEWFTEKWLLTTYYSERLQSALFNIKRLKSEEESIDKVININNK